MDTAKVFLGIFLSCTFLCLEGGAVGILVTCLMFGAVLFAGVKELGETAQPHERTETETIKEKEIEEESESKTPSLEIITKFNAIECCTDFEKLKELKEAQEELKRK